MIAIMQCEVEFARTPFVEHQLDPWHLMREHFSRFGGARVRASFLLKLVPDVCAVPAFHKTFAYTRYGLRGCCINRKNGGRLR
jgi:hypothetical protein